MHQLFKANCLISRGILNQLGNCFLFPLLQDSQDSDDESKCVCKKDVLHSDISHQRPILKTEVNFFTIFRRKMIISLWSLINTQSRNLNDSRFRFIKRQPIL